MRVNTIALLMIFFSSCRTPVIKDVEMCDVSFTFNRCRCRVVDLNTLKNVTFPQNYDIAHCEGIAGFRLSDIVGEIIPKVRAKVKMCQSCASAKGN